MAKKLTEDQTATWAGLIGLIDGELKYYAKKFPQRQNKYLKIQKTLLNDEVKFRPVKAWRKGPGSVHKNWRDGVEELVKVLPHRARTWHLRSIPRAMDEINDALGVKVRYTKMTIIYKYVYTRYGADVGQGADVLIEGKAKGIGTVNYYYDNSSSAEGAHRYAIINGTKVGICEGDIKKAIA